MSSRACRTSRQLRRASARHARDTLDDRLADPLIGIIGCALIVALCVGSRSGSGRGHPFEAAAVNRVHATVSV